MMVFRFLLALLEGARHNRALHNESLRTDMDPRPDFRFTTPWTLHLS